MSGGGNRTKKGGGGGRRKATNEEKKQRTAEEGLAVKLMCSMSHDLRQQYPRLVFSCKNRLWGIARVSLQFIVDLLRKHGGILPASFVVQVLGQYAHAVGTQAFTEPEPASEDQRMVLFLLQECVGFMEPILEQWLFLIVARAAIGCGTPTWIALFEHVKQRCEWLISPYEGSPLQFAARRGASRVLDAMFDSLSRAAALARGVSDPHWLATLLLNSIPMCQFLSDILEGSTLSIAQFARVLKDLPGSYVVGLFKDPGGADGCGPSLGALAVAKSGNVKILHKLRETFGPKFPEILDTFHHRDVWTQAATHPDAAVLSFLSSEPAVRMNADEMLVCVSSCATLRGAVDPSILGHIFAVLSTQWGTFPPSRRARSLDPMVQALVCKHVWAILPTGGFRKFMDALLGLMTSTATREFRRALCRGEGLGIMNSTEAAMIAVLTERNDRQACEFLSMIEEEKYMPEVSTYILQVTVQAGLHETLRWLLERCAPVYVNDIEYLLKFAEECMDPVGRVGVTQVLTTLPKPFLFEHELEAYSRRVANHYTNNANVYRPDGSVDLVTAMENGFRFVAWGLLEANECPVRQDASGKTALGLILQRNDVELATVLAASLDLGEYTQKDILAFAQVIYACTEAPQWTETYRILIRRWQDLAAEEGEEPACLKRSMGQLKCLL